MKRNFSLIFLAVGMVLFTISCERQPIVVAPEVDTSELEYHNKLVGTWVSEIPINPFNNESYTVQFIFNDEGIAYFHDEKYPDTRDFESRYENTRNSIIFENLPWYNTHTIPYSYSLSSDREKLVIYLFYPSESMAANFGQSLEFSRIK